MSLYDDIGLDKEKSAQVAGWSSGIKLFQSQLQLKKAALTQPKREQSRKQGNPVLAPVIDLKSRKDDEDSDGSSAIFSMRDNKSSNQYVAGDTDWHIAGEYDPMWPNEYEKVVKELKDRRDIEREKEEEEKRRKYREEREQKRSRERQKTHGGQQALYDEERKVPRGFPGRRESDEEEEEEEKEKPRAAGVAIAPPPSLQESTSGSDTPPKQLLTSEGYSGIGSSIAAKIMAKYGFKEGQGLGRKEQGIATALQVEKTSKRGGRIICDKDIMPPPPPMSMTPPLVPKPELSITEMMKNPAKVVLLRNMVGPGEVDEDLEPEVKDECNTKYGDVHKVIIYELPGAPAEEAVRIFVEFKRIESAIKAVVDLNGRYFGGRQVKAGFYDVEKFAKLELLD